MVQLNLERFDVVSLKDRSAKGLKFVVLSASHLNPINTLIVAPLVPPDAGVPAIRKMHPLLKYEGVLLMLLVNELANVPRSLAGQRLGSVAEHHFEISSALDFLFQGY